MLRLLDTLLFTVERIWQHRALVLWALVGLSAATTLALSLSLYVDAVNTGLLGSRLSDPPYAFRFRYQGSWEGNISQADMTSSAGAIFDGFPATMGLPSARGVKCCTHEWVHGQSAPKAVSILARSVFPHWRARTVRLLL
jgi:hypothetical protein